MVTKKEELDIVNDIMGNKKSKKNESNGLSTPPQEDRKEDNYAEEMLFGKKKSKKEKEEPSQDDDEYERDLVMDIMGGGKKKKSGDPKHGETVKGEITGVKHSEEKGDERITGDPKDKTEKKSSKKFNRDDYFGL